MTHIRATDGTLLTEKTQILEYWTAHFCQLLNKTSTVKDESIQDIPQGPLIHTLDDPPTREETVQAISQLQIGKAPGPDGIPSTNRKNLFSWVNVFAPNQAFGACWVLYMAVGLYAPSLALSHVAGLSMWISVLGVGVVCTLYTAMGGLRAVMYTDTFQAVVIMVGTLALIVKAVGDVGGVGEVWRIAKQGGRLDNFLDFDPDPRTRHTVWGLMVGGAVTTISLYGINQTIVQRYLAVHKLRHAQATVYMNLPATFLSITLFVVLGLVAYARYYQCDPLLTGRIQSFDQLIPLMVMEVLGKYPGLPGLLVACVFSASLSTVSSGVNALALVYLEDEVKPLYQLIKKKPLTEQQALVVTKVLAVLFGLVTIGLAYVTGLMDQTLVTITIKAQGMTGGPLLGLFFLAMFCPSANSWGAGVGLLCGLAFSFWLGVGAILHGPPAPILPLTPINCSAAMTSQMVTAAEGGATDVTSTWGTSDVTTTLATVMSSLGSTTVTSSANTSAAASPRSRSSST
ncbi:hypothetical protein ACOMHN_035436 [Nucella lapillus]